MNNNLLVRIKRLRIYGIIGICFSLYLGIDYLYFKAGIWELIMGCILFLWSIIFLIVPVFIHKKK